MSWKDPRVCVYCGDVFQPKASWDKRQKVYSRRKTCSDSCMQFEIHKNQEVTVDF